MKNNPYCSFLHFAMIKNIDITQNIRYNYFINMLEVIAMTEKLKAVLEQYSENNDAGFSFEPLSDGGYYAETNLSFNDEKLCEEPFKLGIYIFGNEIQIVSSYEYTFKDYDNQKDFKDISDLFHEKYQLKFYYDYEMASLNTVYSEEYEDEVPDEDTLQGLITMTPLLNRMMVHTYLLMKMNKSDPQTTFDIISDEEDSYFTAEFTFC